MRNMKKTLSLIVFAVAALFMAPITVAQDIQYADARSLTLVNQLFPENPNPYQRIDTDIYSGFSASEYHQVHMCTGMIVAFKTDSPSIWVKTDVIKVNGAGSTGPRAQKGFDLYIKDGASKWKWAGGAGVREDGKPSALLHFNERGMVECLVYLPLFTELSEVEIGVKPGYALEPIPNPFRHRIAVFGSSFTHGFSTSRPAMPWPAQFERMTGLQMINLGCSGNSKLQPYFAEPLADADVDAYVFDAFSNPSPEEIEERLFPFIETIQKKNPGKPLIFLQTIYREWRSFNADVERKQAEKIETAARMMKKACKKFKDVYYVTVTNATDAEHETTVDGTHPGDYGYRLWAESVVGPVTGILAGYGIK